MKRSLILSLIVVAVLGIPTFGASPTDHSFLIGTWLNIDYLTTGGIPAFIIDEDQDLNLVINAFGACTPNWCNWGIVPCIDYATTSGSNLATGFMAFYDKGYAETWIAATQIYHREYKILYVSHFTFFFDYRYDYWGTGIFLRIN